MSGKSSSDKDDFYDEIAAELAERLDVSEEFIREKPAYEIEKKIKEQRGQQYWKDSDSDGIFEGILGGLTVSEYFTFRTEEEMDKREERVLSYLENF